MSSALLLVMTLDKMSSAVTPPPAFTERCLAVLIDRLLVQVEKAEAAKRVRKISALALGSTGL
eukprot:3941367-Rhodomonas_salina.3